MYISAIKGTAVALVVFTVLSFVLPEFSEFARVDIILTISTFLFAIIAGFFISRLNSRYDSIKQLIAEEDSQWLCFYKLSQIMGVGFSKKIVKAIDGYYIAQYDQSISNFAYKNTAPLYLTIWDILKSHKSKEPSSVYQEMISSLRSIEVLRNHTSTTSAEKLGMGQWSVLIVLTGIILGSFAFLVQVDIFSQITMVLLASSLILILLIIRDLQNMMFGNQSALYESGQEVLVFMGLKRYYHENILKVGVIKIPKDIKEYRLGLHKSGAAKVKTKLIKVK